MLNIASFFDIFNTLPIMKMFDKNSIKKCVKLWIYQSIFVCS